MYVHTYLGTYLDDVESIGRNDLGGGTACCSPPTYIPTSYPSTVGVDDALECHFWHHLHHLHTYIHAYIHREWVRDNPTLAYLPTYLPTYLANGVDGAEDDMIQMTTLQHIHMVPM